ncbi:MAG: NfeD family protein [Christensenellales bacterium]
MDFMLWVWIGVVALALIVEAISLDMTSIWFAVGGLCSLIAYGFKAPPTLQIILFLVVSALCIIFLRRITKKFIQKPTVATNIDKIIGTKTKLIESIKNDQLGAVKINGITYSAKSFNDTEIESGCEVQILQIDGNKLIVKACGINNSNATHNNEYNTQQNENTNENEVADKNDVANELNLNKENANETSENNANESESETNKERKRKI